MECVYAYTPPARSMPRGQGNCVPWVAVHVCCHQATPEMIRPHVCTHTCMFCCLFVLGPSEQPSQRAPPAPSQLGCLSCAARGSTSRIVQVHVPAPRSIANALQVPTWLRLPKTGIFAAKRHVKRGLQHFSSVMTEVYMQRLRHKNNSVPHFPFSIGSWDTFPVVVICSHFQPKYKKFVVKLQSITSHLGAAAYISGPHPGAMSDTTLARKYIPHLHNTDQTQKLVGAKLLDRL